MKGGSVLFFVFTRGLCGEGKGRLRTQARLKKKTQDTPRGWRE